MKSQRIVCFVVFLLAFHANAQYTQTTAVLSSGGGSASSDNYDLLAVIGQVTESGTASAGNYVLSGGFIYTITQQVLSCEEVQISLANSKADVQVTATVAPYAQVDQVKLFYRAGGATEFTFVNMTAANEKFVGKIPGSIVTSRGVEYYLLAAAKSGSTSRWPESSVQSVSVTVAAPGAVATAAQPNGESQNNYRLVSFPLDLVKIGRAHV